MELKSPACSFSGVGTKILKSLVYCLLGAVATWLLVINNQFDFGVYAPFIGALAPLIANLIKEFIQKR